MAIGLVKAIGLVEDTGSERLCEWGAVANSVHSQVGPGAAAIELTK